MSETLEKSGGTTKAGQTAAASTRSGKRTPALRKSSHAANDRKAAFICPVFRRGQIVQALATDKGADGEMPLYRSAEQAFELGRLIASDLDDYYIAIETAVREYAENSGRELASFTLVDKPDGNNTSLKFAPGMIIDFAEHDFVIDGVTLRERSCITVCRDEEPSKLWTRFVLISGKSGEVSAEQAKQFYRISEVLSTNIIEKISHIYLNHFNIMRSDFDQGPAKFNKIAELDFYGFDNREVGSLIKDGAEEQKDRLAQWVSEKCRDVLPFEPTTHLGRHILKAQFDTVKVSTREDEYESTYAYFLNYVGKRAVFLVAAGEPNKKLKDEMVALKLNMGYGVSQSLTVINDLANRIAGQF
ncbi:MAG: hypothetical protein ACKOOL_11670 [Novosphingobium sp.]